MYPLLGERKDAHHISRVGSPCCEVANDLGCDVVVSDFALFRSLSDSYPWEKFESTYPPIAMDGIVPLLLFHKESWYSIKQRKRKFSKQKQKQKLLNDKN